MISQDTIASNDLQTIKEASSVHSSASSSMTSQCVMRAKGLKNCDFDFTGNLISTSTTKPPAYQVRRFEPLAIINFEVIFRGYLGSDSPLSDLEDDDAQNDKSLDDATLENDDVQDDDLDDDDRFSHYSDTSAEYRERDHQECNNSYVKGIPATIMGTDTVSGKQVTLGQMKANLLQVHSILENEASLSEICEGHSHPLAMLHRAFFTVQGIDQDSLPPDYVSGDVLMLNTVRLESRYCGYVIRLLAANELVKTLERELPGWCDDGMVVIDPTAMNSDLTKDHSHEAVQEKLIQHW